MKHITICLLAAILSSGIAPATAQAAVTEITASGSGSISLPPDVATVRASVETNAATATDATSQNNALYDRVVAELERLGIMRQDISLDRYNVEYVSPSAPRADLGYNRVGYTVDRNFSVTVRDIAKAGTVTDACLSAGATGIYGISFGLSNEDAVRARATAKAVADARSTAQTLAGAARLRIVGIKAMQVGSFPELGGFGTRTIAHVTARAGIPTELDQSNVNVTVSVGVIFVAEP